jgi:hypothetical protein
MDKKTYYISIQASSILENQGDAAYEFEVEATEQQISRLQELFDGKEEADNYAFGRSAVPWVEYHNDRPNDVYDFYLKEVYGFIHSIGTIETKEHIESMNIL